MSHFRTDRIATLYCVRPLRSVLATSNPHRLPILMYHSISQNGDNSIHPYFVTETSPKVFESQMQYLHDNGYSTLSLDDVVKLLKSAAPPSRKYVAITFDDGYRNFYTDAFPTLSRFGFRSTVFLPTAYINHHPRTFKGRDCLTWPEVRELQRAGVCFGSHTVNHPQLRLEPASNVEFELRASKETIENELGNPISSFAYPYAFPEEDREFTRRLCDLLRACGYQNGVSTIIGSVHSLEEEFFLKRLPANSWDDIELFRAKLEGNYDWLYPLQFLTKWIKSGRN